MARASDALRGGESIGKIPEKSPLLKSLELPTKAEKESVRQADETPIEETNPCLEHPCNIHAMQQQHIRLKDMSKCQRAKWDAESHFTATMSTYVPSCDSDGTYSPTQFWGSTGYSWCALADGTEVPGTRTPPGVARKKDCSIYRDPNSTKVKRQKKTLGQNSQKNPDEKPLGLVRRSKDYPKPPSCYERPCTSHKDCEDCDLACWNYTGHCNEWVKLLSSP